MLSSSTWFNHRLRGGAFPGKEDGIPEKLLCQQDHELGAVPYDIYITFYSIRFFLLFQQVKVAADGGQGRPQIMGDIGDRRLQLRVPLAESVALFPEPAKLYIDRIRQAAHLPVPAGNVDQRVGIGGKPVGKGLRDLPRGLPQHVYFEEQPQDKQHKDTDKAP